MNDRCFYNRLMEAKLQVRRFLEADLNHWNILMIYMLVDILRITTLSTAAVKNIAKVNPKKNTNYKSFLFLIQVCDKCRF